MSAAMEVDTAEAVSPQPGPVETLERPSVLRTPADPVREALEDRDLLDLTHSKVEKIPVEEMRQTPLPIRRLVLRQNALKNLDGLEQFPDLQRLDVYLNHLTDPPVRRVLPHLPNLTWLDLSFNEIRVIEGMFAHQTQLRDLYLVKNKITCMRGIRGLTRLRQVELGSNRIRKIEGLEDLVELEELWLALNKIVTIEGLDTLAKLRILSLQNNRIVELRGLDKLANLEELHLSHNGLQDLPPGCFAGLPNLRMLDLSCNRFTHIRGLTDNGRQLQQLEELWFGENPISSWDGLLEELQLLPKLRVLYLERTPIWQSTPPGEYVERVLTALPGLRQLDAEEYEDGEDEGDDGSGDDEGDGEDGGDEDMKGDNDEKQGPGDNDQAGNNAPDGTIGAADHGPSTGGDIGGGGEQE